MPHRIPSEDELISTIERTVTRRGRVRLGIGDDAAVLRDGAVITTDAYAAGVHFDLSYMTLRQVGERCACGAISDVVAMAAEPEAVLVALALPRVTSDQSPVSSSAGGLGMATSEWRRAIRQLYAGIDSICAEMRCEVAGGDIIVSDQFLLALTVTGRTREPRLRSGARPGDWLYVTGNLGSAEAGRVLLDEQVRGQESRVKSQSGRLEKGDWRLPLVRRHLRPIPRLAVMKALRPFLNALIDTSDGLATDARHICERSNVRVVLEAEALPITAATERFCLERGIDPVDFALRAGEDYELLFTSRRSVPCNVGGVRVTAIGRAENGRGLWIERAGRTAPVAATGYDHLRRTDIGTTCY